MSESTGEDSSFRGHISDQWSFGTAPNGGILTSLAISAARKAAGGSHKDPLSVSTHFVQKVNRGGGAELSGRSMGGLVCICTPPHDAYARIHIRTNTHTHTCKARENAPAVLRVRRLAAARSQETLSVSLLQPEEEGEGGGRLVARAHFLMTFGTLARFKVRGCVAFSWGSGDSSVGRRHTRDSCPFHGLPKLQPIQNPSARAWT